MELMSRKRRREEEFLPLWPRDWESFFEDFLPRRWLRKGELSLDVTETDSEVIVTTDVPGVDAKDIEITVTGDVLTIRGEKKEEKEEKKRNYRKMERWYGSFGRSVTLPSSVDQSQIKAKMKNGILTITLPKREEERPKAIKVETE